MLGVVASLLAVAAPAGIQIATPEGSGAVSLALIEVEGGTFLQPLDFPGADGEADGVDSSLFEHSGTRVVTTLAGPALPSKITIRRVYPEMAGMRRLPVVRLAFLERTDGGYWHVQWDAEVQDDRACLSRQALAHFRVSIPGKEAGEEGDICFDV